MTRTRQCTSRLITLPTQTSVETSEIDVKSVELLSTLSLHLPRGPRDPKVRAVFNDGVLLFEEITAVLTTRQAPQAWSEASQKISPLAQGASTVRNSGTSRRIAR